MPPASCPVCGSRLPRKSRFCPECGARVGASTGETAVQAIPEEEAGRVPVELMTATPRFFGVTPPAAVLALAAASLALAVLLFATGHVILGAVLLAVAIVLGVAFAGLARRLPETPVARASLGAMSAVKAHAGLAVEALTVHSSARVVLFRQRRELVDLLGRRTEAARALGEAVYAGKKEETKEARAQMKELDGLIAAKEEEMQQTAAGAMERIQRAQLQVQPTQIEAPEPPSPEPFPSPDEPGPVPVPEPSPEPSEPPGPVVVPEPGPEPSPPAAPQ
ncbi:MAG: zinc-ribbon domain-containing protein [Gaiellaceae bacterium]